MPAEGPGGCEPGIAALLAASRWIYRHRRLRGRTGNISVSEPENSAGRFGATADFEYLPVSFHEATLLDYRNVSVYRGDTRALDRLSLSIGVGEHVAILGPNGCGKSTLIKTFTRECYPAAEDGRCTLASWVRRRGM